MRQAAAGMLDAAGRDQRAGVIGEPHHDPRPAGNRGDAVGIAPAVLQREDRGLGTKHRRRGADRRLGVIALDEVNDEIDRANRRLMLSFAVMLLLSVGLIEALMHLS